MGRERASARFEYLRLQIRHETREIPAFPTQRSEYIVAVPTTKTVGTQPSTWQNGLNETRKVL